MEHRNPKLKPLIDDIRRHPNTYYTDELAKKHGLTRDQVSGALKRWGELYNLQILKSHGGNKKKPAEINLHNRVERKRNTKNVLVIGDLHEPFTLDGYLDFCITVYKQYDCTHVVFMGDVIDNAFTSYHEINPDGMGAGRELDRATQKIEDWTKAFPIADVCIGNHDRLVYRKAHTAGISSRWIRHYSDVLNATGWEFAEDFVYDNVRYVHGEQGTARIRAKKDLISTVQGHRHAEAYTEHFVGESFHIFGMQVGCGIDRRSYAMHYARAGSKPAIACGVILEHGTLPINVLATLKGGEVITP